MPLEKLVFATTVEALFVRGLGGRLGCAARRRLKAAGLDLDFRLEVAYPLEQWKAFLGIAAEELYPQLPAMEAHWRLGEHFIDGYLQTCVGRVVRSMAEALGALRTLAHVGKDVCSGNNFAEFQSVELGSGHLRLWMNDVLSGQPGFAAGALVRVLHVAGASEVHVDVVDFDGAACTFDIHWVELAPQLAASA
jgi:uncharacterized protein (TIGR02265 family)